MADGGGGREDLMRRVADLEASTQELQKKSQEQTGEISALTRATRELTATVQNLTVAIHRNSRAGLHLATIDGAGSAGSPADIDSNGRVEVKLQFEGKTATVKASVPTPWLLSSGGAHFSPRKGQDVLVAFSLDNPDHPMVIGYLAGSSHPLPYDPASSTAEGTLAATKDKDGNAHNPATQNSYKTVIRSASTGSNVKKGEIAFIDDPGKEGLSLATEGELRAYAKGDQYVTVGDDRTMVVDGNLYEKIAQDHRQYVTGSSHKVTVGDKTYTVYGDVKTEHHAHSALWQWGDQESLFMGAQVVMALGNRTDIYVGGHQQVHLIWHLDFRLGWVHEFRIGFGTTVRAGSFNEFVFGSSVRSVSGNHTVNINGLQETIINGSDNRLLNGFSVEVINGGKLVTKTTEMVDGELRVEEISAVMGQKTLNMNNDELRLQVAQFDSVMADFHCIE